MRTAFTCFLLLMLLSIGSSAQRSGPPPLNTLDVEIRVTTGQITGLPRVELALGEMPLEEQFADSRGHYAFVDLRDGEYTVTVSLPGYETVSRTTFLRNGSHGQMTFMLRPTSAEIRTETVTTAADPIVDQRWLALSKDAQGELTKAREARAKKDYKEAVVHSKRVLASNPKAVLAQLELGLAQWQAGHTGDAKHAFDAAITQDPHFLQPYLAMASMLSENHDYADAGSVLMRASKAVPGRAEPFKTMAEIQLETGHPDKAEVACQMGLQRDYSHVPEINVVLANALLRQGKKDEAAQALEAYLKAAPKGEFADAARNTLQRLKK